MSIVKDTSRRVWRSRIMVFGLSRWQSYDFIFIATPCHPWKNDCMAKTLNLFIICGLHVFTFCLPMEKFRANMENVEKCVKKALFLHVNLRKCCSEISIFRHFSESKNHKKCTAVQFQLHCGAPIVTPQCKFRRTAVQILTDLAIPFATLLCGDRQRVGCREGQRGEVVGQVCPRR